MAADTVEAVHVDTFTVVTGFDQLALTIERESGMAMSPEMKDRFLGVLVFWSAVMPHAQVSKNRSMGWLDAVILVTRQALIHLGVSASLSFTDLEQTCIDRPFARCLRSLWRILPPHSRSKTPEALIARARRLRTPTISNNRVAVPDNRQEMVRRSCDIGLEMIAIVGENPRRCSAALRQAVKTRLEVGRRVDRRKVPKRT